MGFPTFAPNEYATQEGAAYWTQLTLKAQEARHALRGGDKTDAECRDDIVEMNSAVGYGDAHANGEPAKEMAKALRKWYGLDHIKAEHILFTQGASDGLHAIFKVVNQGKPGGKIVTTLPYYSLYVGADHQNHLHGVNLFARANKPQAQGGTPGYSLTAEALRDSIRYLDKDYHGHKTPPINAFLFCDTHNPTGRVVGAEEWRKIATVVKEHPEAPIILDEAYAEMVFSPEEDEHASDSPKGPALKKQHVSLLEVAPELRDRIIILRSASKALSLAGERIAVVMTANAKLKQAIGDAKATIHGSTTASLQTVYAKAMNKLDKTELHYIERFYRPQVELVQKRLREMGATMPDPHYRVEGAF